MLGELAFAAKGGSNLPGGKVNITEVFTDFDLLTITIVELSRCAALNRSAKSIDFRKQSCFRMLMVLLNEIEIEMFCFQKLILGDYSLSTH